MNYAKQSLATGRCGCSVKLIFGGVKVDDYKKTYWYNIEDFYQEYHEHPMAMHLQEKYEELIRVHGYRRIMYIEELIERDMMQTPEIEETRKKAISKLTKEEIFEVVTTLAFLSGIATGIKEEMEAKK